ncbi:unnamed protein product, partial [Amoebophrya sp. A25]
ASSADAAGGSYAGSGTQQRQSAVVDVATPKHGIEETGKAGDESTTSAEHKKHAYTGWYSQKQAKANLAAYKKKQEELARQREAAAGGSSGTAAPGAAGKDAGDNTPAAADGRQRVPKYSQKQAKANLSEWNRREQERKAAEDEKERKKQEQLKKLEALYKKTAPGATTAVAAAPGTTQQAPGDASQAGGAASSSPAKNMKT